LRAVRRTLVLVSAIVCFESLFYTVLAPLLPHYSERFGLSVARAGLLTGAYAAGALLAAIPSGLLVTRIGVKATALGGLALLSLASIAFGLATNAETIFVARVAQGCGCALAWTGGLAWLVVRAPEARRGELIGFALGAAVAGALLGPAVGALASVTGAAPVFVGLAVPAGVLVLWGATLPGHAGDEITLETFRRALTEPALLGPVALIALAGLLLGTLSVLAPLHLADVGFGAGAIGGVFVLSAAVGTALNPYLGRWSDRRGRIVPLRLGLVLSAAACIALAFGAGRVGSAAVVFVAAVAFGLLWTPATALLSDGSARLGYSFAAGFALLNLAWPPGQLVGSAASGALAGASSSAVPYGLAAVLCLVAVGLLRR
jgi:MFS family permease